MKIRNFSRGVIWNAFPGEVRFFPMVFSTGVGFSVNRVSTEIYIASPRCSSVGSGSEGWWDTYLKRSMPGTVLDIFHALSRLTLTNKRMRKIEPDA